MKNRFLSVFVFSAIVLAVLSSPDGAFGQNWRVWSTTPVFDGGRVMPLSSFAQQIVKDICGSPRPYIVPDNSVLKELNRVIESRPKKKESDAYDLSGRQGAFLPPPSDDLFTGVETGLGTATEQLRLQQESGMLKIRNLDRDQAEQILQRINTLLPSGGRAIDAPELLLSWFAEPEVWDYIPIFEVPESDYRNEILEIPDRNDARVRLRRVALFQLEQSLTFQLRLSEIEQQRRQGDTRESTLRFNRITKRLATAMSLYQDLTFHPRRHYPGRMVDLLNLAGDVSGHRESSYASGFGTWNYLLGLGDDATVTATARLGDSAQMVHPTTERWHAISRKIMQLTTAFDQRNEKGDPVIPNLDAVERQFELLLQAVDANLDEAVLLMKRVYPEVRFPAPSDNPGGQAKEQSAPVAAETILPKLFSPENRGQNKESVTQLVLAYHFSLKKLRREIEAAYIALYDNGRTLRIMPILSDFAVEGTNGLNIQPWASMQLVLHGGDAVIKRFLDPAFPSSTSPSARRAVRKPEKGEAKSEQKEPAVVPGILSSSLVEGITGGRSALIQRDEQQNEQPSETETGEKLVRRGTEETESAEQTESTDPEETDLVDERYEIDLFGNSGYWIDSVTAASLLSPSRLDPIRKIRNDFYRLFVAYTIPGLERRGPEFKERGREFQQAVRAAAVRAEMQRRQRLERSDSPLAEEMLDKTGYPAEGIVDVEYRYFRFSPFFWMWLFAAVAIGFILFSFGIGIFRRDMIDISKVATEDEAEHSGSRVVPDRSDLEINDKTTWRDEMFRPDFSNSPEEYTLWIGFFMLGLSIFVSFLGGAMRAWISGWAPVTNMYETVVFLAFSASIFGLWYALYPILQPALSLAWRYSCFPTFKRWAAFFQPRSQTAQSDAAESETVGQYAMRQAAEDFGVVGMSSGIFPGTSRSGIYGTRSGIFQPGDIPVNADNLVDSLADPLANRDEQQAKRMIFWQSTLTVPRLILMLLTFLSVIYLSYGEFADRHGVFAAAVEMLSMHDFIDWIVVLLSIGLIVWFVPHLILTGLMFFVVLARPKQIATDLGIISFTQPKPALETPGETTRSGRRSEMSSVFSGETLVFDTEPVDNCGSLWLNLARNRILNRKLLVLVAAVVALAAGLVAYLNTSEFNPNIRPLMAVLRSNFWLTVHVIAIIVSYAAALIAWGMAAVALGGAIFGRYRYVVKSNGRRRILLPAFCDPFIPSILKLLRMALLLLAVGTILGARWADYSWGRFWSWDPKEVWALITILYLAVVLHGRIARYYGPIGVMVGAQLGSIAVIVTWYGINFVFKGSQHSYGGDATGAMAFLLIFIGLNALWIFLALFRYSTVSSFIQESDSFASMTRTGHEAS